MAVTKSSAYLKKLKKIFKEIDKDKQTVIEPLIFNAAFMAEELDKLRDFIVENGWTEEYQNGANQKGKKKSSEGESYQNLIKNFVAVIKQLKEFMPEDSGSADELELFLKRNK